MGWRRSAVTLALSAFAASAQAQDVRLPVLVPLTGFVALEGTSQKNGALLAASQSQEAVFKPDVLDTAATPEAAVNAWARAVGDPPPLAVVGPILGTQMLALLPLAKERDVPLLTISGTARLSEMGVPQFFRFFPSDATVKVAHARYVVEKLGARRPAVIYQSTAYGQSGREQLAKTFAELKGVCAETAASPVAAATPAMRAFLDAYRTAYKSDPDAYAAAQYDGVRMLGDVIATLRREGVAVTPGKVREKLAAARYQGVATTYWSDGKGDMAHDAEIVCFDGNDRVPRPVARYSFPPR